MAELVLASGSQRRAEILRRLGIPFSMAPQDIDETFAGADPHSEAIRLAGEKLDSLLTRRGPEVAWALAADTFILCDGDFIGKPSDRHQAAEFLSLLSDREHRVITGLAMHGPKLGTTSMSVETRVLFGHLSRREIDWYLDTEEWRDAAGAYRIQEKGAVLVEGIEGSYSNVMGLPIRGFYGMLWQHGYPLAPGKGAINPAR